MIAVLHATRLVAALEREAASRSIVFDKQRGATRIIGGDELDIAAWKGNRAVTGQAGERVH